ncbi:mannitol-specific phosphotransferase system IIBC component [Catenulispora sp. MAP12-49]|jgi:mannitol-specific phosphotransferase system IIBC component|uniref:PTS lactose transporter subunit IIB n=1 Tax=Catenulispora sp. MAP12-49 TaxID=3156302 RepID=UPI0035141851
MTSLNTADIKKVIVACDAGMGSSVMLAGHLRRQLKKNGVVVDHAPVSAIPADADLILTNVGLAERVRASAPGKPVVAFQIFLGDPAVEAVVKAIKEGGAIDV